MEVLIVPRRARRGATARRTAPRASRVPLVVAAIAVLVAVAPAHRAAAESGQASAYAARFDGRRTASGERYDPARLTAAHRTLAFGTRVRVTNLANGRSVPVRVNDRGNLARGRIIDLSPAAARAIGMDPRGVARVTVEPASRREATAAVAAGAEP